ncbi:splicing factor YJU2-like [Corticium candelabrum]|uniref:splicing factor YJU2-like n=1 Tax=Corticium candelabrum TaxID=121492 RepID=UPI002E25751E|nr:splicing factor YJU2-like [Corticium candelabrum]
MTERKVLNKYFPPDFDFTKIPKLHLPKDRQYVIRIMAPFSMQCNTCGNYVYKGKKFNARRETVQNDTYLGLRKYRFYIRCPGCISEIVFRTDPETTDYVCEGGATRTFEAQKLADEEDKRLDAEREEEEMSNPMKALESRTKESKREMDILDALEEIKDQNSRFVKVDHEDMLSKNREFEEMLLKKANEEDEAEVQAVFGTDSKYIRRIKDDSDDEERISKKASDPIKKATDLLTSRDNDEEPSAKKAKLEEKTLGSMRTLGVLVKKKVKPELSNGSEQPAVGLKQQGAPASGLSLLGGYEGISSSNSESDSNE